MKKQIIFLSIILFSFINGAYSQNSENYVARFNGFYNYVTLDNNPLNTANSFTLEAWVNPTQIGPATMSVIGKNYQTGFFLGIQSSGRIVFYPRGSSSLRSRVTSTVPAGKWTHIAATYNGAFTAIYINGVFDTSTTAITGALSMNNDSIRIGADRLNIDNLFFYGYMDNVRIWAKACTASEIMENRFIQFSVFNPTGKYLSLNVSLLLNNNVSNSGGYSTDGIAKNISFVNYTDKAVNICDYNNNLVLKGTTDYCSHVNRQNWFDMPGGFTLESWVKRDTTGTQPVYQNIISKSGGTNGFDYGIYFSSTGDLYFAINNFAHIISAPGVLQTSQWTHVAASYNPSNGKAVLYCNGDSVGGDVFPGNPAVQNNPYNVYFGASGATNSAANKFKGQLDDIKIWFKSSRTQKEIKENMFSNKINEIRSADSVVYITFDKYQTGVQIGGGSHVGDLRYFGNASVSSAHANTSNLSSPVINDPTGEFNSSSSSVMSKKSFFIPDANVTGITDSIYISDGSPVSNLRVCILLSHTFTSDLYLILTAPSGSSVYLLDKNGAGGNDIMTIFSDAADSSASSGINVNGPGINSPFSPLIKASQPLSILNGQNRKGWWKLKIVDNAASDIGYLHGWGLNMKSQKQLNLSALIQGFYNNVTNKMIKDTATVFLRNSLPPYSIFDSSKSVLDSNGKIGFYFNKAVNGSNYFIVLKHRNSIDTWSSSFLKFANDTLSYDFTSAASKAYGNNQINIDASPVKFAVYNGDINRDGSIDLTDMIQIYNSASAFVTGYEVSDVTGDRLVDLTDVVLAFNNSAGFVMMHRP